MVGQNSPPHKIGGMNMTIEKLAQQIYDECAKDGEPVTMEEAFGMAKMEIGAKDINNYTQSAEKLVKKTKKPKTVKISNEKQQIFSDIVEFLKEKYEINVEINNKLIIINEKGKEFKLNLSETRQKKA